MKPTVTVVVPVLNEEATLATQIEKLRSYLDLEFDSEYSIDLVIADNGSTDRTRAIASDLRNRLKNVETVFLDERGVGLALKAAWSESTADIVGYMDLDLATDLSAVRPALQALASHKADVVNGSRLLPHSIVQGRRAIRNITSRGFNILVRWALGTSFTDGMCGFKFLRREVLEDLQKTGARSDGWFFATQLLVIAEKTQLRVLEIPVTWTDDPNSRVNIVKLTREYVVEIVKLRRTIRNASYV